MITPILCLDFDGVCHNYVSGWCGADVIPDPPVLGLFEFLYRVGEHFVVAIYSTRSNHLGGIEAMRAWFGHWEERYRLDLLEERRQAGEIEKLPPRISERLQFPTSKPPAFVTLDDRALTFTGIWPDLDTLRTFQPWNRKTL